MKTSLILLVEINFTHELLSIRGSKPTHSYYSNLSLAVRAVENALSINGWPLINFNYTKVYRALKDKGQFNKTFKVKGTPFFKIRISKIVLNPKLDSLEIGPIPVLENG